MTGHVGKQLLKDAKQINPQHFFQLAVQASKPVTTRMPVVRDHSPEYQRQVSMRPRSSSIGGRKRVQISRAVWLASKMIRRKSVKADAPTASTWADRPLRPNTAAVSAAPS
jgi:hypothetical protein